MMKRVVKIVLAFVFSIMFIQQVSAVSTCTYERQNELNAMANNIKTNVEAVTEEYMANVTSDAGDETVTLERTLFNVQVFNLTNDLYIVIKDTGTKQTVTYRPSFTNNIVEFKSSDPYVGVTYEISVYSNDSNCMDDLLSKTQVTTPKLNRHYTMDYCRGMEEYHLCKRIVNGDADLSETNIINSVNKYKAGLVDEQGEEIEEKANNNIIVWIILGSVGGVAIITIVTISVIKFIKRRRSII